MRSEEKKHKKGNACTCDVPSLDRCSYLRRYVYMCIFIFIFTSYLIVFACVQGWKWHVVTYLEAVLYGILPAQYRYCTVELSGSAKCYHTAYEHGCSHL